VTWRSEAACIGRVAVMFPSNGYPSQRAAVAEAKAVCDSCPVSRPCLEAAVAGPREDYGIWAGFTAEELFDLRTVPTMIAPPPYRSIGAHRVA
jgi:WhiB family redox-sensing transcriptional regulator